MTTTNDTLRRIALLFGQLADLAPEEQEAALLRLRETEPEIEAAVRRLIRADVEAPESLETETLRAPGASDAGGAFGQYRAVRVIGEGGMGAVYLAERSDGQFTRKAAIKVIQGSLVTDEMRARFVSERQILASLQHPGIANLLDGGVTEKGEPYLVMEFIEGLPLDAYCDQRRLTIAQRVDLFLEVCAAVDFAHRHLIIHRDLKPSNILVNGEGKAKLLDFGAAKLLGPIPADRTKQFLTPRYASPEQMRGESAAVSMDVYALGIVFYELLTGKWPFGDPADMASNLRRAAADVAPAPPTATQEAASVRSTSEASLQKTLAGDLTAILCKALETNVAQRYGNVTEFAADIQRFRGGQPVLARPQTAWYKVRKWIGRNPLQTAAAALAIAGILTGVALREQQRLIASQRFDELRSLARYQIFELQEQMYFYGSPLAVRKAMAERSMQALQQLSNESAPSFELQADLTEGFTQLAELLGNPFRSNLGEPEQGRKALARAKQMNEVLQAMNGPVRLKQAAKAKFELQEAMYDLGATRTKDRLDRVRQSMEAWEAASQPESMPADELGRMAMLYLVLSVNQGQIHGVVDAYQKGDTALPRARRLIDLAMKKDPKKATLRFANLQIGVAEANILSNLNNQAGRQKLIDLVGASEGFDAADTAAERVRFVRARIYGTLGWLEGQMQLFEPALNHLDQCTTLWRQMVETNPTQLNLRYELAGALRDLGFVNAYAQHHNEAAAAMQESIQVYDRLLERGGNRLYTIQQGELRIRLGSELLAANRADEARAVIQRGLSDLVGLAKSETASPRELMQAARYLIDVPLADYRRPAEALEFAVRADRLSPRDAMTVEMLVRAYAASGKRQEAQDALKQFKSLIPETSDVAKKQVDTLAAEIETLLAGATQPSAIPAGKTP